MAPRGGMSGRRPGRGQNPDERPRRPPNRASQFVGEGDFSHPFPDRRTRPWLTFDK
jgi:hypothetical protein